MKYCIIEGVPLSEGTKLPFSSSFGQDKVLLNELTAETIVPNADGHLTVLESGVYSVQSNHILKLMPQKVCEYFVYEIYSLIGHF
jgi:hypothetical protein